MTSDRVFITSSPSSSAPRRPAIAGGTARSQPVAGPPTRLFRRETGTSPAAFSRALRLDQARSLLQTSFLTVKPVMAASGWSDPSHFSREFSRRHGRSPLAFRRFAATRVADEIEGVTEEEIRQ
jgi:hypothetical protein